jgi:hypothetical protein
MAKRHRQAGAQGRRKQQRQDQDGGSGGNDALDGVTAFEQSLPRDDDADDDADDAEDADDDADDDDADDDDIQSSAFAIAVQSFS